MGTSMVDLRALAEGVDEAAPHIELTAGDGDAGSIGHAGFLCWMFGSLALILLLIGSVNWYVDATGITGRTTKWLIAENAEVRAVKLDLYDGLPQPPETVLFGSSRVMKFDPADAEQLTGDRTFNAAVSGGVPRDALLFTMLLAERQSTNFPHVVWGLDVDAFRNKQLRDGLATDPRMSTYIPRSERVATWVSSRTQLVDWQTTKATWRSVRAGGGKRTETGTGTDDARAERDAQFSSEGMQQWSLAFPKGRFLDRQVRKQIAQYAGFIFERDAYDGIEDAPLGEFEELVRIANEHGDTPDIFLTPYHPLAEELLAKHDIGAREREVRAKLRELQNDSELRFQVVDLTDIVTFGGDRSEFYDGVHMTPVNTRRALEELQREGGLTADGRSGS